MAVVAISATYCDTVELYSARTHAHTRTHAYKHVHAHKSTHAHTRAHIRSRTHAHTEWFLQYTSTLTKPH
jgi:hypothetical protein